jgi:hypothetical protein
MRKVPSHLHQLHSKAMFKAKNSLFQNRFYLERLLIQVKEKLIDQAVLSFLHQAKL